MNINLIYQNNSFNFDLRKDASIKYLEDLASKLINKDKASFNLSYKDNILTGYSNTLLKDILKSETNVHITISPKMNRAGKKIKKDLPKLRITNHSISNTESIETKNNLIMNETELSQSFSENSIKVLQHLSKHNFGNNKKQKNEYEYITKNKIFEEVYNSKESELLKFLKILSQKIKEYDDFLYKKYKQSFNKNNNELLLFEKNVMNFKDKQVKFIKKLIEFFDDFEKNFLNDFYNELNMYYNKEYIIKKNNKIYINFLFSDRYYFSTYYFSRNFLEIFNIYFDFEKQLIYFPKKIIKEYFYKNNLFWAFFICSIIIIILIIIIIYFIKTIPRKIRANELEENYIYENKINKDINYNKLF